MKIWLLRPARYDEDDFWQETRDRVKGNPWSPWYDKTFGAVVRAPSEIEARKLAAGDTEPQWLDATLSTCVELTPDGEPSLIISDFHRA